MQPDPLSGYVGDPQSLNLYAYVRNNPLNLIDPDGRRWVQRCHIEQVSVRVGVKDDDGSYGTSSRQVCEDVWIDDGPLLGPEQHKQREQNTKKNPGLKEIANCAARNSSEFTIAFVLGIDDSLVGDTLFGATPVSNVIALATEPSKDNVEALGVGLIQEGVDRGIRPATAAAARSRVGPDLQTLQTRTTGPRLGSTPLGGAITRTVSQATKALAKVPTATWEASVFAFSFAMCSVW